MGRQIMFYSVLWVARQLPKVESHWFRTGSWNYLKENFIVGLSIEGADGSILLVSDVADLLGAVEEVDGDAGREGEDPGGADSDGRVQLGSQRDALHRVDNSLGW